MGFIRLLTDKGGHLRTTRLPAKAHLITMLLACSAPEEIWPRTEDLRPRRSHDLPSTMHETTWTTHTKQTPHGEDTEGVELQVPSLSPAIPVPRVPPDPSRTKTECQHRTYLDHKHGTPPEPLVPLEARSTGSLRPTRYRRRGREERTGIGVFTTVVRVNPTPLLLNTQQGKTAFGWIANRLMELTTSSLTREKMTGR